MRALYKFCIITTIIIRLDLLHYEVTIIKLHNFLHKLLPFLFHWPSDCMQDDHESPPCILLVCIPSLRSFDLHPDRILWPYFGFRQTFHARMTLR